MKKNISAMVCLTLIFGISWNLLAQESELKNSDQSFQNLKDGNKRYVENKRLYSHQNQETRTITNEKGQHPFATIIACSDSRVPVEHIFDVGIGDVFIIRVAGNVVDVDEAGSIEYGVDHLHTPLFVVMGHSSCGAVTAVVQDAELHGNIPKLVDNIVPAANKAKKQFGDEFSNELLEAAIKNNVWQSIEDLLKISPVTADLVKMGKLKIVGAVYHLDDGHVEWLGEHPDQEVLLNNSASSHH